jgi:hypothetical protein
VVERGLFVTQTAAIGAGRGFQGGHGEPAGWVDSGPLPTRIPGGKANASNDHSHQSVVGRGGRLIFRIRALCVTRSLLLRTHAFSEKAIMRRVSLLGLVFALLWVS